MRLNRDKLLSLWDLEALPTCDAGIELVEAFRVSCGGRFGKEGPEDRLAPDHGQLYGNRGSLEHMR